MLQQKKPLINYTNQKLFKCYDCGIGFSNENSMKEHLVKMHNSVSNSAKDTSKVGLVFSEIVKDEVEESDNFDVVNPIGNQDIMNINFVKVEKLETEECNLEDDFMEPAVKQIVFEENCGDICDAEGLMDNCGNYVGKTDSTM